MWIQSQVYDVLEDRFFAFKAYGVRTSSPPAGALLKTNLPIVLPGTAGLGNATAVPSTLMPGATIVMDRRTVEINALPPQECPLHWMWFQNRERWGPRDPHRFTNRINLGAPIGSEKRTLVYHSMRRKRLAQSLCFPAPHDLHFLRKF